jgi:hypothetical protein
VVLGTHVNLSSLTVVTGGSVDVFTSLVTTNERDGFDVGVRADVGHSRSTTLNNINDTLGDARLGKQINQDLGSLRHLLRRLEDESVTEGNGEREHPKRNHSREVEGSNTSGNTKRNSVRVKVNTIGNTLDGFTLVEGGKRASVLNNFVSSEDITLSIEERFAVLAADSALEFIGVILDELLVLEHVSDLDGDGNILPGLESLLRVGDSFVELSISGLGNLSHDFLVERVDDIVHLGALGGTPLTIDVVSGNV